jgi:hypothetical protein
MAYHVDLPSNAQNGDYSWFYSQVQTAAQAEAESHKPGGNLNNQRPRKDALQTPTLAPAVEDVLGNASEYLFAQLTGEEDSEIENVGSPEDADAFEDEQEQAIDPRRAWGRGGVLNFINRRIRLGKYRSRQIQTDGSVTDRTIVGLSLDTPLLAYANFPHRFSISDILRARYIVRSLNAHVQFEPLYRTWHVSNLIQLLRPVWVSNRFTLQTRLATNDISTANWHQLSDLSTSGPIGSTHKVLIENLFGGPTELTLSVSTPGIQAGDLMERYASEDGWRASSPTTPVEPREVEWSLIESTDYSDADHLSPGLWTASKDGPVMYASSEHSVGSIPEPSEGGGGGGGFADS